MDLTYKNGIRFLQKGKGKDLVFFHGYLSNLYSFQTEIDYFSNFYKVTAFDFRGFGGSEKLVSPFSVGDYAKDTEEFLCSVGVSRPLLVAHSFGVRVAVKLEENAEKNGKPFFEKMVFTGPAGIITGRNFKYYAKVYAYKFCRKINSDYAERKFGSSEYKTLSPVMKESYKKIVNEDLRGTAENISCKTLIIEGRQDTTTPKKQAEIYLKKLQNAKIYYMDGGHFAFLENPVKFIERTEEFFSYD